MESFESKGKRKYEKYWEISDIHNAPMIHAPYGSHIFVNFPTTTILRNKTCTFMPEPGLPRGPSIYKYTALVSIAMVWLITVSQLNCCQSITEISQAVQLH